MSGASIRAEVDAALREVGRETGNGELVLTFTLPLPEPDTPWEVPSTDTPETIQAVAYNRSLSLGMIDGALIQAGDKLWLVSALDVDGVAYGEPQVTWRVSDGTRSYAIMMVKATSPAGVGLMYLVQGRA